MNILVCRTDKLGDFITALPALYVLKNYSQLNKIVVCVAPINKELANSCEFIDEVIVDNDQPILELVKEFKSFHIDASIALFSNTRVALALFLANIKVRIAPATKIAQIFYNHRVKQRRSEVKMAEFEYNLELLKELFNDVDLSYKQPLLEFKKVDETYKDAVAFHVGFGGSSDANWTLDEYEVLIRIVLKSKKHKVILTFGPDEKTLLQEMQNRLVGEDVIFYLSLKGIVDFAKIISTFKVFISTSTGTYHLASLVGTPTITFFGDSDFASAKRWKSVGDIKLQQHYMLPLDENKRATIFKEIQKKLSIL